jgi:hypothetical protein
LISYMHRPRFLALATIPSTRGWGFSKESWPAKAASSLFARGCHFSGGAGSKLPREQMVLCLGPLGVDTDSTRGS